MDNLSKLPDSVLAHTLSFLPTKEAIKTTILSKRFENQWTSVSSLSFHGTNSNLQFVNHALALWGSAKNPTLHKFDVEFPFSAKDFRVWLRFAVDFAVKHLRLVFNNSSWDNSGFFFTLPQYLYSNSTIESFEFACCALSPRTQVDWRQLKKLKIKCVRLSNELIKNLICGSVQLDCFEICDCKGYDSLVIGSASLKTLKITDNFEESNTPVTISAPNIKKLCISGYWDRKIAFECLSALVDAEVNFFYRRKIVKPMAYQREHVSFEYPSIDYIAKVTEHLHCHLSTETLVIGTMFIEALNFADVKTLPRQLSKCRSLTLSTNTETNVLKGILNMVKMLPNLEVLILDMEFMDKWYSSGAAVERFLMSEVEGCGFLFQHLKFLRITCHVDRLPVLPFIKFLLERAQALKTMSILPKTASSYSIDYMFQLIRRLSDMPRSSPVAEVVLCKGLTKIQVQMDSCNFSVSRFSDACPSKMQRTAARP